MTRSTRRGATIHGCMVLVMVLCVVVTFGMYNSGRPIFHEAVAMSTGLACMIAGLRRRTEEAAAFGAVAVPAAISSAIAGSGRMPLESVQGVSGLLYAGGAAIYVVSVVIVASRAQQDHGESQG